MENAVQAAMNNPYPFDSELRTIQGNIERAMRSMIDGPVDLDALRPIGVLPSGQLNAVSMLAPGRVPGYLVVFEDQMPSFAYQFCKLMTWALPRGEDAGNGQVTLQMSPELVAGRIAEEPRIAEWFTNLVVAYARTGQVAGTPGNETAMPPGYFKMAGRLASALEHFIVGHEHAHILMGHLEKAGTRKGVLPVADVETLAYSWQQELDADMLGAAFAINAGIQYDEGTMTDGFWGITIFFDAMEVMDRAVALLQTGDEQARQLGSHPPSYLRKQRLREFLPKMGGDDAAGQAQVSTALGVTGVQEKITDLLWERARPRLEQLRKAGVAPAPIWRSIPKEAG